MCFFVDKVHCPVLLNVGCNENEFLNLYASCNLPPACVQYTNIQGDKTNFSFPIFVSIPLNVIFVIEAIYLCLLI